MYELNKLKEKGVIQPVDGNDLSDIEPFLLMSGLTEDEFRRLLQYLDKPITISGLSAAADVPMHKMKRLKGMGFFGSAFE